MAKKKKRRGKQGLASRLINAGLLALTFARPLEIIFKNIGNPGAIPTLILRGATFGLAGGGGFSLDQGTRFYGPVAAAFALGAVKKFAMRKFPVR